jgi:outer membrane protein TolC
MINKNTLTLVSCMLLATSAGLAQEPAVLTIDSCYAKAKRNYPLTRQYQLLEKSAEYSIDNANKAFITRFNIGGQASYQSAVTELPISIPGVSIKPLSKDQYRLYGELNQPLTDLITLKNQKELIENNAAIEKQKLALDLYSLQERINNLFFGILLIDAQIEQTLSLKKDLQIGIDKTEAAIENGIAIRSNANNLKAQLLKLEQRLVELKANRDAYSGMLSLFIGTEISAQTELETPGAITLSEAINRPELALFELQKQSITIQSKLNDNKMLPKLNLFVQGGIGRPALNMLSNDFAPYYIGGLKLNWNISSFYTNGKEKKILAINQEMLDVKKEVFLFNTNLNIKQENTAIAKTQQLIATDKEIIALQESIKKTTMTQLETGTATTNDYLLAVNDQDQAQQNLLLHEIQLLMNQYKLQTTTGK